MKRLYCLLLVFFSFSSSADCLKLSNLYEKEFENVADKLVLTDVDLDSKGSKEGFVVDIASCGIRACDTLIVSKTNNCYTTLGIFYGHGEVLENSTQGHRDILVHFKPTAVDQKLKPQILKFSKKNKKYE